ncbi:UNVERIFIED_CONTAM: hypothetical protein RF648_22190 [Kocuria sp. CPCC 205274]
MSYYRELQLIENGQCPCCENTLVIGEDDQYLCKSCDISVEKPEQKRGLSYRGKVWVAMIISCLLVFGLFFAGSAMAMQVTGFLTGQFNQNGDNICVYNAMGHSIYQNVGFRICPLSITTDI